MVIIKRSIDLRTALSNALHYNNGLAPSSRNLPSQTFDKKQKYSNNELPPTFKKVQNHVRANVVNYRVNFVMLLTLQCFLSYWPLVPGPV